MKFGNFSLKLDHLIVGSALIIGSGAAWYLWNPTNSVEQKTEGTTSVGKVIPLGRDIRHKTSSKDWSKVQAAQNVFEMDRIYAGEDSRARVDLDSGGRLYVSPSTLVTISKFKNDQVADLESGSLISELFKGGKLLIKQGSKVTELSGEGKVFIRKDTKKGLVLQVFTGLVTVKKENHTLHVNENQVVAVAQEKSPEIVARTEINLLSPANGSQIWISQKEDTTFKWSETGKPVRFSIAYSPDFKLGLFTKTLNGTEFSLPVHPFAQYYWKVEALNGETADGESTLGSFAAWKKEGPTLLAPAGDLGVNSKPEFSWRDFSDSTSFKLEVATDADFKNSIVNQDLTNTSWTPEAALPAGTYFWRVTSHRAEREDFHSEHGTFSIAQPALTTPLVKAQWKESTLGFELYEDASYDESIAIPGFAYTDAVKLAVEAMPKAQKYEWTLTSKERSRPLTKTFSTSTPELRETELSTPGVYNVKWRYQSADQQWSQWSDDANMRVIIAPPKVRAKAKKQTAQIKWSDLRFAANYELILSDNTQFSPRRTERTRDAAFKLENLTPGTYFARVRALNEDGWPISPWSKAVIFESQKPEIPLAKLTEVPKRHAASVEKETLNYKPESSSTLSLETEKPKKAHRFDIWSGLGSNYLKFSQQDSSGLESGEFSSVTSPTFMVETRFLWNEDWNFVLSYNQMPGKIQTNPSVTISKTDYLWTYFSAEAERYVYDGPAGSKLFVLGGFQRHQMPFLVGGTTFDVDLIQTQLTTGSLGARIEWQPHEKWLLESFMRYQIPLTSESSDGGSFKTTGGFSFDGLLGISRELSANWKLGLFWFGQSHNLQYSYSSSDGSTQRNGTQTLFNSDLQLRFGYQWRFGDGK